jgi:hypothetical protein
MRKHLQNRKKIQIKYELNKRFLAVAAFILVDLGFLVWVLAVA